MNIFLTGQVQVGKSTVLNRLIQTNRLTVCGFRTKKAKGAVKVLSADGKTAYICALERQGRMISVPFGFERAARTFLEADPSKDFYLMDELGILERNAPLFRQQIMAVLDSGMPVLGVLKKKEDAFLRAVAERPDSRVIEVTAENREAVFQMLCREMQK